MNCINCSAELKDNAKVCYFCGTKVESNQKRYNKILRRIFYGIIATFALITTVLLVGFIVKKTTPQSVQPTENVFYIKGDSLYHTPLNEIKPLEIVKDYYKDHTSEPQPLNLSTNGKWLFYSLVDGKSEYFRYRLNSLSDEKHKIASDVESFTTNTKGNKFYYISKHNLYKANTKKAQKIDQEVSKFYTDQKCSRIIYSKTDGSLYEKNNKKAAKKIADQADIQYVSKDLNTIYYLDGNELFLIKNCQDKISISKDKPLILYVYENGDMYYQTTTNSSVGNWSIFYCSEGHSKPVNSPFETLTKIKQKDLKMYAFNPNGKELFYIINEKNKSNLYHVSLNKDTVSESKMEAKDVIGYINAFNDDSFAYLKNPKNHGSTGDLYINNHKVDTDVCSLFSDQLEKTGNLLYAKNVKQLKNNKDKSTCTLMLYHNGRIQKIADNVVDYKIQEDKIIYLSLTNASATSGLLRVYNNSGENRIIDTDVNTILTPNTYCDEVSKTNDNQKIIAQKSKAK